MNYSEAGSVPEAVSVEGFEPEPPPAAELFGIVSG